MYKDFKHAVTIIFALFCLLIVNVPVKAATPTLLINLTIGSKTATINGKEITLDVPPMVVNGRTLVPLRFIGEALGATLNYDAVTRKIVITAPDSEALLKLLEANDIEITNLKKQLENNSGGLQSETISPEISCNNIMDNQVITKLTNLDVKITDQSPIAFVRIKIGNILLSENSKNFGYIDPTKLLSGSYPLLIEAWDSFGNRGEKKIFITIQNIASTDPFLIKSESKEMKRGPGGGGGGNEPPGPPGGGENPMKLAALTVTMNNNSLSTLDVTNIEVFDQNGVPKKLRSDGGIIDMLKRQVGLNHILIIPTDSLTFQASMAPVEEGKEIIDMFKGWKVTVTLFDSIMQKEITKTVIVG